MAPAADEEAGYTVITAFHGTEALAKVRREWPDLILLDLFMPPSDEHAAGLIVADELRADPATASTPMILLTAPCPEAEPPRVNFPASSIAYLYKPFSRQ